MSLHYRFFHTCGHTGIGPLIYSDPNHTHPHPRTPDNHENAMLTTIQLTLQFSCPFCLTSTSTITLEVPPGQGILTILSPTFPWMWSVVRACKYEDITPQDWAYSMDDNGCFRQMAWIPKPCGEVRVTGGLEEVRRGGTVPRGVETQIAYAWRQRADEKVGSRFAGMLSQLNAAVLSGEQAGR
jgi:hypothetical protein